MDRRVGFDTAGEIIVTTFEAQEEGSEFKRRITVERTITVNQERCIHCGLCLKDCIAKALEFDSGGFPHYADGGAERCLECQHCMAICPAAALSFGGVDPDELEPTSYGSDEELLKIILSRRSVRLFKNESVPPEKIEKISALLSYPPTGVNIDSLHFSIVSTKEKMNEIVEMARERIMTSTEDSPIIARAREYYQLGEDLVFRTATAMAAVAVDTEKVAPSCKNADPIIALSYLELYAHTLGLGAVWCGLATVLFNLFPDLCDAIKIPEGFELNYIVLLGVPDVKYARVVRRERNCVTVL